MVVAENRYRRVSNFHSVDKSHIQLLNRLLPGSLGCCEIEHKYMVLPMLGGAREAGSTIGEREG